MRYCVIIIRVPSSQSAVKSLLQIQEEQQQQIRKHNKQPVQLSRSHPTNHNPLSSSVWSNTGPLTSSWTSGSGSSSWGSTASKPQMRGKLVDDDEDDDCVDDEKESFWDECVKVANQNSEPAPRRAAKQQTR